MNVPSARPPRGDNEFAWSGGTLALGEVVGVHIDDSYPRDGRFNTAGGHPLARCRYQDFAVVESVFALARPKGGGDV